MITCNVKTELTVEKDVRNQMQNHNSVYAEVTELLRGMLTQR